MKTLVSLVFVLLAGNLNAQTLIKSGDKLQWDQGAASLAEANSYQYELAIDVKTPQEIRMMVFGVKCIKGKSSTLHDCSAPVPVLPVGTHTLSLTTLKMMSLASLPLTVSVADTDVRCLFPTGEGSLSIFATRLLLAGSNAGISFQLGAIGYPVKQITILLAGPITTTPVAIIKGNDLNNVGMMWFPKPVVAGKYQVIIQAYNDLGCLTTVRTSFFVTIE